MATFNLQKGRKFQINKGVATVMVAMGWDVAEKAGENFDLDASAFGLVITPQGSPKFFGDGSHGYVMRIPTSRRIRTVASRRPTER